MVKIRLFLILVTVLVVGSLGLFISYYARGYKFNFKTLKFMPSGILVIKSDPTGASIYVDNSFKAISDNSISLSPGTYDVTVKKDGYLTWQKRLTIDKEVVTEAYVALFKSAPSLSPVTFNGATDPVISSDFSKIAYLVTNGKENQSDKTGLWLLETVNLPFGFAKDPRRITDGNLTGASWQFSPDGREILLNLTDSLFELDSGSYTPQAQRVNILSKKQAILNQWAKDQETKLAGLEKTLPPELTHILTRKARAIVFSPDETKILYMASGSATLKDNLIPPLPGSSTQKQDRAIKDGNTYIYDIKEDRNFLIDNDVALLIGNETRSNSNRRLMWFPTSKHLVLAEEGKIIIMDYDGTNKQTVYSGSYISPHAYPFASTNKLLILTNLGANQTPNLYSLSLK